MKPDRFQLAPLTALTAIFVLIMTACASHSSSAPGAQAGSASPTKSAASAHPSGPQEYATKHFAMPMTLTVDSWLKTAAPDVDSTNLVYWSTAVGDNVVRFMLPAIVYAQGAEARARNLPANYLQYLHGTPNFQIKDETSTVIGGHPATLLSITANSDAPEDWFSGSLGCVSRDSQRHDINSCFAINSEHQLRLAVIKLGGRTLLSWARTEKNSPDAPELYKNFATLLASVRFR